MRPNRTGKTRPFPPFESNVTLCKIAYVFTDAQNKPRIPGRCSGSADSAVVPCISYINLLFMWPELMSP